MSNKKVKALDLKVFKRLMKYSKKYRLQFIIALVSAVLLSGLAVARPYLLLYAIDFAIEVKDKPKLVYFITLMFMLLLVESFTRFSFIFIANQLGFNIIKDIRMQLYKHMLNFRMSYFDKSSVGQLVTRVITDIERIASFFGQGFFMIIVDLLTMLVAIIVMTVVNWRLAIINLVILPILVYATQLFQKAVKVSFKEVRLQAANLNGFIQERVTGMNIVQLFNREKIEYKKFYDINNKHKKAWVKTVLYYSIFFPIAEVLTSIALGLIVWYGGFQIIAEETQTTIGEIMFFIMISQMLFRPLRQIADKFNTLQMGIVAGERVFEIIDTESHIDANGIIEANHFKGTILFENVRFSYVNNEEVLKGISFKVNKGETVAIVGATGAGKSTIINLINRFYDINSGEIKIDNKNIKEYTIPTLRKNVAVVLQDVFLFSDTIYKNIVLDKKISLDDVKVAAKEIGIHEFITSLPNGYDYNVKERGVMLSSGQRQLIAFLRAYVSNPSILILDEATSSIDSYSEQLIQDATDKITQNQTSIIIAHRLTTIQKADKIIVMDKGLIVEQGTHKELLEKDGYYSNLYDMQFKKEAS
ncbi:ABC transporter ATP-binding protein [Urechidicola croceus]|uniref:Antibiotic ABC transporter ATP-binding protein n=1 Tax=Urechidicola croceus TaxID=1850246 RepID=A0A1D8P769_9FLAO|nr:ABC transporter ATP-binding protein [Urechidicola croceus]AOW20403.1 antibiotic ABC transporter ATP-binding protein [Urechidicola croceus]